MKEIVIVTAYNRPELLALCLEHLSACPEIQQKEIWVRCERRNLPDEFLRDNKSIAEYTYGSVLPIRFELSRGHGYAGNSFNTLTAYTDALLAGAERVYLVEDDVLVSPDFFRWHAAMYRRNPTLFCSVGWHCLRRSDIPRSTDPRPYFTSREDFASIGLCWTADMLSRVVYHATNEYFNNPAGYLHSHFPNSDLSLSFSEQDGLIMHVLQDAKLPVAWPYLRRCSHIGWWGYHRPSARRMAVSGPGPGYLPVRVDEARRIANNPADLQLYGGGLFGGDLDTVVSVPSWEEKDLYQVACL